MDAASETTVGGKEMSMEETAVLLSIHPEWCQKIFRGEKTMEIRKNFPKDFRGQPFKCFIYCTKGQNARFRMEPDGSLLRLDGTVIGEFTCDKIYKVDKDSVGFNFTTPSMNLAIYTLPENNDEEGNAKLKELTTCMTDAELSEYLGIHPGYAWHITELKTYETPLDLAAFHLRCENALRWCNNGGCAMHIERPANGNCCGNYGLQLNRPPQSWCYVVGPGECHKELQEQVKATLNRLYPRKKVSDILPKPEILGQLAEELAEASAAASKLRRKIDGKNPTPKTLEECWEDLKKEIGDVMNSIDALTGQDPQSYHEFMSERFPHWPYKKPKPGHEGFRLLDGPAPDFHRMTVEEFEALPPHIWMDVKKTLPPLEHPVLTVDAYGNYHTNTEYIDNPEIPFCITYNNGRFWPPIAWSKFDRLKWSGD